MELGLVLLAFVVALLLFFAFGGKIPSMPSSPTTTTAARPTTTHTRSSTPSFQAIPNKYKSIEEVQKGLREAGLESSNLIIGVDYTKSNTWTGSKTFGNRCLHALGNNFMNPYQVVISILGRTLEAFDDDRKIPIFGFGDSSTRDNAVFPFFPNKAPAHGLREALARYNQITPGIEMSGPTSFAPIIREAIDTIKKEGGYHILVIIADGQVSNETPTRDAIVEASNYPLSIILVGVGDGPWDTMKEFDDGLPARKFDNFQFVEFHDLMTRYDGDESTFAMFALMEIPDQYKEIKRLGLL